MIAALLVQLFVIQVSVVRGQSMQPNLHDGDRLVVDCVSPALTGVERFDLVIMRNPADPRVDYVKRVVGLPGDRIAMWNGLCSVNGQLLDERFAPIRDYFSQGSISVPDGYFFVLGDNRPVSRDSRSFGLVPAELIRGEVRLRFWPLDRLELF